MLFDQYQAAIELLAKKDLNQGIEILLSVMKNPLISCPEF